MFLHKRFLLLLLPLIFPLILIAQHTNINAQNLTLGKLSVFTENKGQIIDQEKNYRNDVKYMYASKGFKVIFKQNSVSYEFYKISEDKSLVSESSLQAIIGNEFVPEEFQVSGNFIVETQRIDLDFKNSNIKPVLIAEDKSADYINYYNQNAPAEGILYAASFKKLTYKNIWPNIDIVFYAKREGALKYDVIIHPGGNLQNVQFLYSGAENIKLSNGKLHLQTTLGFIDEKIPLSYLKETNETKQIDYEKIGNTVSFHGRYDKSKTLVIDPVLEWATYIGGEDDEGLTNVVKDSLGNLYVCGVTKSISGIATSGAHQTKIANKYTTDVILVKLDSAGNRLWATYYGGQEVDQAVNVAVDRFGNLFVSGFTRSDTGIATIGSYQETYAGGGEDVFVAKFNAGGKRIWATYFGGDGFEIAHVSIDKFNNIYLGGGTTTKNGIATSGAFRPAYMGGSSDAFLAKFDSSFNKIWGTYFGGNNQDFGYVTVFDKTGNIYMTGFTESTINLASAGAHQTTFTGASGFLDAFLVKFSANGKNLWSTYYGGSSTDYGNSIATDKLNNIYLAGETSSVTSIATPGSHQPTLNIVDYGYDAFLAKFDSTGVRQWGTYYGGKEQDLGQQVATDTFGNVFLSGWTRSENYISTLGAHQLKHGGNYFDNNDIFLVKFDADGKRKWGTYYGGEKDDHVLDMMTDISGNIYLTGGTNSKTAIATTNAFQPNLNGIGDAFIAKFARGAVHDISLNNFTLPNTVCATDSFNFSLILSRTNNFLPDSSTGITFIISGSDSLLYTDIIRPEFFADLTDTFTLKNFRAFAKPGVYNLKVFLTTPDEDPYNDTFATTVIVYPKPEIDFSYLVSGSIVHFYVSDSSFADYKWYFGDGDTSHLTNPFHQFTDTGTYHVRLLVGSSNSCTQLLSDTVHISTNVGLNGVSSENARINVYPNPFSYNTLLELYLQNHNKISVSLSGINGKSTTIVPHTYLNAGKHVFPINADELSLTSGTYLLRIEIDGSIYYQKIMKF